MQNELDITDLRPMSDHLDLFKHIDRDRNDGADHLTHKARAERSSWHRFQAEKELKALRI